MVEAVLLRGWCRNAVLIGGILLFMQVSHAQVGWQQVGNISLINEPIFDVIIGKILWDPADIKSRQPHESSMDHLDVLLKDSEVLPDGIGYGRYHIVTKNSSYVSLINDYLSLGLSFRQVSLRLLNIEKCSRISSIGSCTYNRISKYTQVAFVVSLQKTFDLLEDARVLSPALDIST